MGNLREMKQEAPKPKHKAFKSYEPGYLHVDVKYLPLHSDEEIEITLHRYVWLYNQELPQSVLASKTPVQAKSKHNERICDFMSIKIQRSMLDNHYCSEINDRIKK